MINVPPSFIKSLCCLGSLPPSPADSGISSSDLESTGSGDEARTKMQGK